MANLKVWTAGARRGVTAAQAQSQKRSGAGDQIYEV